MPAQISSDILKEKFCPIYGKFLKVALEATFNCHINLKHIQIKGITLNDLEKNALTYTNYEFTKVYQQSRIELVDGIIKIHFIPWVKMDNVESYRLVFRAKPIGYNFPIFARFGEERTFGFSSAKPYINLDYFSLTQGIGFNPVYTKIMDRGEIMYLKIASEEMGVLEISRVEEMDVPPHLVKA